MRSQALKKLSCAFGRFTNATVRARVSAGIRCYASGSDEPTSQRSITLKSRCKLWKLLLIIFAFMSFFVIRRQFRE